MTAATDRKMVLVVDGNLARATELHSACLEAGCKTIVARDLPTALLMMSQHLFAAAVISSNITEEGDGWPLASVFRMVFPRAFVVAIARERTVMTLQAAINHGVDDLVDSDEPIAKVANAVTAAIGSHGTLQ